VFTFSARPQTGWLIGITALIYLSAKIRRKETPFVIAAVLLGIIFSIAWQSPKTQTASTAPTVATLSLETSLKPISLVDAIQQKQEWNQAGAASKIETPSCPFQQSSVISKPPSRVDVYFCILWRAPYMSSAFLFRPFIATDVTSPTSLIAALENIIWTSAIFLIICMMIKIKLDIYV
jgi:hypothetical protein